MPGPVCSGTGGPLCSGIGGRFAPEYAGRFEISVKRYKFQAVAVSIMLTANAPATFDTVEKIFNKTINIYNYTFTPQGNTGTWTKITLKFSENQQLEVENIEATNEKLLSLYNFVKEHTEPAL